jgi:DNA invertase Pin-like site-specific DNA recombinase
MIGYLRVSTAREDMLSPELQEDALTGWARANNRRIVAWLRDLDHTGRDFARRKVAQGIAAIEAGEAAEIGVYRYDRWGRNAVDSLANCRRVEMAGGAVVSATEPLDPETAIGRYNRTNAFALAEMQSDLIGEGWTAVHKRRVAGGLPAAGTPRFGYVRLGRIPDPVRAHVYRRDMEDPAGERYVPDPRTGPILAGLYERYVKGEGPRSLARFLNEQGILTARGGPWSRQSVMQVLASGFAAGLLRAHDGGCKCGRSAHQCPKAAYYPGRHEAVITPETWRAFLERRSQRREAPSRAREPVYPLSGLLCHGGRCGARLTITYNYGTPGWGYRCPRRGEQNDCDGVFVRRHVAEERVLEWLGRLAADIDAIPVAGARSRAVRRASGQVARFAAEETRARNALARLLANRALDPDTPARAYEEARAGLMARLEAAQARVRQARDAESANAGAAVPVARPLMEEWDTFTAAERREGLGKLIRRIDVHRTGYRKPPRIEIVPVWAKE